MTFEYEDSDASSVYQRGPDKIVFRQGSVDRDWTAAHEFGHALHHESLGGIWNSGCPNPHYVHLPSNYKCALKEGIADYAGDVGNATPGYGGWEGFHRTAPYHRGNGEIEGNVAALFHDLIDSNNEGDDETTLDPQDVMTVFRTCRNSGGSINDTADFVWCLENRVDTTVHRIRFQGLSAPRNPQSTRPSSWDADDIRSTWTKNVG